jgi:hypothetical protein
VYTTARNNYDAPPSTARLVPPIQPLDPPAKNPATLLTAKGRANTPLALGGKRRRDERRDFPPWLADSGVGIAMQYWDMEKKRGQGNTKQTINSGGSRPNNLQRGVRTHGKRRVSIAFPQVLANPQTAPTYSP